MAKVFGELISDPAYNAAQRLEHPMPTEEAKEVRKINEQNHEIDNGTYNARKHGLPENFQKEVERQEQAKKTHGHGSTNGGNQSGGEKEEGGLKSKLTSKL